MKPPAAYGEWLDALDAFAVGTEAAIEQLEGGTFDWPPEVGERLMAQVSQAASRRLAWALGRFGRQVAVDATVEQLSRALGGLRGHIAELDRLAHVSAFPDRLRDRLREWLSEVVTGLERDLVAACRGTSAADVELTVRSARIGSWLLPFGERVAPPVPVGERTARAVILP